MNNFFDSLYDALGITTVIDSLKTKESIIDTDSEIAKEDETYHSEQIEPVKFDYTPQTLDDYIGQDAAKARIRTYIKKVKTIKPVHLVVSGTRGHGKSTIVYIICNMLGVEPDTYVGGSFTIDNLKTFLQKNSEDNKLHVLFLDEIHSLSKEVSEYMLPLLKSFVMPEGNQKVKPFLMMGATTNLEILQNSSAPFLDRCDLLELDHYNSHDIKTILKNYNDKLYKKNINEEVYDLLSINIRYNPRTTLSAFDDFIIEENIETVLKGRQVIKDGLTTKDLIVLKHLAEIKSPVGNEVLAIITNQTKASYKDLQEPYLLQYGYISRKSRGRVITEKGLKLLSELQV